eukprot:gene12156-12294_t
MLDQYYRDGKVLPLPGNKGVLHVDRNLDEAAIHALADIVGDDPGIMSDELAVKLQAETGQGWDTYDFSRALLELDFERLQSFKHAVEADSIKQDEIVMDIMSLGMGPKHFVFVDAEVAADSRCTNRQYVGTLKGTKMCSSAVFVRGQRITTIAAMYADGLVAAVK